MGIYINTTKVIYVLLENLLETTYTLYTLKVLRAKLKIVQKLLILFFIDTIIFKKSALTRTHSLERAHI